MIFVFRLLARASLATLHRLGALLGWLTWLASPTYRRHLRGNMALALGADSARRVRNAAIANAGRTSLELPRLWLHPLEETVRLVREVRGWDYVEAAQAAGKGILFLTPHLGCFEVTAQYYSHRAPISVLYRPPKQAWLQTMIEEGRARPQLYLAPADLSGVRTLIKSPEYYLDVVVGEYDAPPHKGGTVEKCTFCKNLIDRGDVPACMQLCPGRARYWGDLDDPESDVSKAIEGRETMFLNEEAGTKPSVYYLQ